MTDELHAPFSRLEAVQPAAGCRPGPALTLAEMAREFGVTPRALRFYEAKGLLRPGRRGPDRLYDRDQRRQLVLLLRAKALGFTLGEIRTMLDACSDESAALNINRRQCFEQIRHLEQRKREIETALAELRRIYSSFYARIAGSAG